MNPWGTCLLTQSNRHTGQAETSSHICTQIHAKTSPSALCYGLSCRSGRRTPLDLLYLLTFHFSRASQMGHMALSKVWFQLIWEKSLLTVREPEKGRGRTERIQHEWNISKSKGAEGWDDETQLQSRPLKSQWKMWGQLQKRTMKYTTHQQQQQQNQQHQRCSCCGSKPL